MHRYFNDNMALAPSILVLGATGVSGIASRTRVVEGNLTDRHALLDAMEGVDTVVSFLGAYPSLNAFVFRTSTTRRFPGPSHYIKSFLKRWSRKETLKCLDWTIFRVPHLTTDAADLPVWAGLWGPEFKGSTSLSRESMSRWVLQEIEQRKWVKGAPALGNY
ncbi:hypothetical protein C8J57DRAFT_1313493 [Mycena rebaudengoi]|nr:hypothetical protein C8J57DRAFT_1313493 [Mycena rebaudengoi]